MAFVAIASTSEPRSFSIGPLKVELQTFTAASGDTAGTITATRLTEVKQVFIDGGLGMDVAPAISGNTVTLSFADPADDRAGTILLLGV